MTDALPPLMIVVGMVSILAGLVWMSGRIRRRGMAGAAMRAAMAAYAEAFQTTAHQAHAEIQVQNRRMVARPSPDDRPEVRAR
jgi:Tfp pilus assembly protein PilE